MTQSNPRVFLDTSVIIAAVLSETGGARKLFQLGEIGLLHLAIGPSVLRECEAVVKRKAPATLPGLAKLLDLGAVEITKAAESSSIEQARVLVSYVPDAAVLAEAMQAAPDWFVTHDKTHFLRVDTDTLEFQIGTPGDLIQSLAAGFAQAPPSP